MSSYAERMIASNHSVFVLAEWLHHRKYTVTIPRQLICPPGGNPLDYVDKGDIFMMLAAHDDDIGKLQIVNGKHSGTHFTADKASWRHPHLYVNRVEPIERSRHQPDYYIMSADYCAVIHIPGVTREHWYRVPSFNGVTQREEHVYCCPIELTTFMPFRLFP